MEDSLGEETYPGEDGSGGSGRNALDLVNRRPIERWKMLTCRRNTLEAITQLKLMCEFN